MPQFKPVTRLLFIASILFWLLPSAILARPVSHPAYQTEQPTATSPATPPPPVTTSQPGTPTPPPIETTESSTETVVVPATSTGTTTPAVPPTQPSGTGTVSLIGTPLASASPTISVTATTSPPLTPQTLLEVTPTLESQSSSFRVYLPLVLKYDGPQAAFTAYPLIGPVPLAVTFINSSTHATTYIWDFGNGITSTALNPTHIYTQAGVYTVTLIAGNGLVSNTISQINYLTPFKLSADLTAASTPSPDIGEYAVLGLNSVWFHQRSELHRGQVGVQTVSPGPVLEAGAELTIGEHVTFHNPASAIAADTIKLKQKANIFDIFHNQLDAARKATYGRVTTPLTLPLVSNLPSLPSISPGSVNYTLAQNQHLTLPAGAYGEILLRKKATLTLTGGVYHLLNLSLGEQSRVQVTAPTELRIANRLEPGQKAVIGPAAGSALDATDLVLFIAGINGSSGNLGDSPKAAALGEKNIITATLYVPHGTLWLKQSTQARGAFIAKDVQVGEQVQVWLENAFAGGYQPPGGISADFSATPLSGSAPLTVTFTNSSTNASNFLWSFGDGITSTASNPVHSYTEAGVYTVTLTAAGPGGSDTVTRTQYINIFEPVVADFSATPLTGTTPLSVTFANHSTGATGYLWDFGDSLTSTLSSPTHVYTQAGIYPVSLAAMGPGGFAISNRADYITVYELVLADFSATPLSGTIPLTVTFSNNSAGATDYLWSFGDGLTSTLASPTHGYTQAGTYTIALTVSGPGGSNTLTRSHYITVSEPVAADFSATPLTGTVPLTVTFINSSTGASNYRWDFGDGIAATIVSPTHLYTQAGIYTITLTAGNGLMTETLTRASYITVTAPIIRDWRLITPTNSPPSIAGEQAMVYDSSRRKVVIYGGNATGWPYEDATWEFNGSDWSLITTTTTPATRYGAAMAYDPSRAVTVLFGGSDAPDTTLDQTWEYNGADWIEITSTPSPPRRTYASLAAAANGVLYLFGGNNKETYYNDLWQYQHGVWREISTTGNLPPARTLTALAFVPSTSGQGQLLLFGGRTTTGTILSDLWLFDLASATWLELNDEGPPGRMAHTLTYDLDTQNVVLVGGITDEGDTRLADTWYYQLGQRGWVEVNPAGALPAPAYHQTVYNDAEHIIMLFSQGEVWGYE